jgi:hypothetical protein
VHAIFSFQHALYFLEIHCRWQQRSQRHQ